MHHEPGIRPTWLWSVALALLVALLSGGCSVTPASAPLSLRFAGPGTGCAGFDNCRQVARRAAASYVKVVIHTPAGAQRGRDPGNRVVSGASGIIMDPAGWVVTAAHSAKSTALEARVVTMAGHEYAARIVRVDRARELALLRIINAGRAFSAARPAETVQAGQAVLAIGTPDNRPGVATTGQVLAPRLGRRVGYGEFAVDGAVALRLPVAPGNSGGPVFDRSGRLVGMVVAFDLASRASGELAATGVAYAIGAHEVVRFQQRWRRHGE